MPGYTPGASSSTYNNVSLFRAGWYGGDQYTGQAGDPGNYGHVDNSATLTQAIAAAPTDPTVQQPYVATVKSDLSDATQSQNIDYVGDAYTTMYDNDAWILNNVNFTSPASAGTIAFGGLVSSQVEQFGVCVAGLAGIALFGTEAAGAEALTTLLANSVAMGATLDAIINDCVHTLQAGISVAESPAVESIMMGAGNSIMAIGRFVGDFTPAGSLAIKGVANAGSVTNGKQLPTTPSGMMQYATPGFTPSASMLDALKPDLTAKALATYVPHG